MMKATHAFKVLRERLARRIWQHQAPILLALPAPYRDLAPLEIEILHPELKALLQSKPAP